MAIVILAIAYVFYNYSRIPNVIADFIGDNVNDIAGNCSDLLESFVATMAAAIMIAVTIFKNGGEAVPDATFNATCVYPIVLAGVGLLGCLLRLGYANMRRMGDNPSRELDLATWISAGLTVVLGFFAALIEYFSALLTDNTIESARLMADEGDRQLSRPGVLEGVIPPDYNRCIEMAAKQALKKMLLPSVLALMIPIIGGFLFGVEFVGGLLVGATIVAIPRAIFMGNSGGAFDNAKKYIESGSLKGHGKGSTAHKASVTGDTVGDTRKDVVGVALDIFIKTMSTVANTLASVFSHFTLIK